MGLAASVAVVDLFTFAFPVQPVIIHELTDTFLMTPDPHVIISGQFRVDKLFTFELADFTFVVPLRLPGFVFVLVVLDPLWWRVSCEERGCTALTIWVTPSGCGGLFDGGVDLHSRVFAGQW